MSLNRLPAMPPQPPAATPTRDIRAVQRAFFQAAVSPVAEPAPAARTAPAVASATAPVPDPERPLRPGSFVDIRV
jgi:hypothetical protein